MGTVKHICTDSYGTEVTTFFTDSRKEANRLALEAANSGADFVKVFPSTVFKYRVAIHQKRGK